MRLLLVKLSSLGDVIHNLPVASDLARHRPAIQIDWAVEAPYAELVALHPSVRRVYPVGLRALKRNLFSTSAWGTFREQRRALRQQTYDAILDTQGLLKSAWVAGWARGAVSGFDRDSAREPIAARFYQRRFALSRDQHAVTRNRALAAAAFDYVCDGEADYGLDAPGLASGKDAPSLVLLHATSRTNKMWPAASWVELGRRAAESGFCITLPWGSGAERATSEMLAGAIPGAIVPPAMSLVEAARLMAGATAVVGVDTGLAHLSVALQRPTIGIYITTQPRLTGLHGAANAVNLGGGSEGMPCVPTVETVWGRLQPFLAGSGA